MKKFVVLSMLVAIAGISVGIIRRQEPAPPAVAAASAPTTTTISLTPVPTAAKAKAGVTLTTARRATSPAAATAVAPTTTPRPAATTSTTAALATTTTMAAGPAPTCTLSPDGRAVRLTSNLPNTPYKMNAMYPPDPPKMNSPQQFTRQATTDAAGGDLWNPVPSMRSGTARISVSFYPAGARSVSGLCSTSFTS